MFKFLLISGLLFFLAYGVVSFLAKHFLKSKIRQNQQRYNQPPPEDEKRFSKDIGEYVTYEEVRDEEK